jgi:hypothetical protein
MAHLDQELDEVLCIFRVDLHISSPYLHCGLPRGRVCERPVKRPNAIMLSNRKCSECSIESSTGEGNNWLKQQKLQIHFPYLRHLVEKDDGALEQGIDFLILGSKYGGI